MMSMNLYEELVKKDPSKYPARMGLKWDVDEVDKLLAYIQEKTSLQEIASAHQRSPGGIRAQINKMAAEYWFNDRKPIEKISNLTGLSKSEIEDIIDKENTKAEKKEVKKSNSIGNAKELQPKPEILKKEEPLVVYSNREQSKKDGITPRQIARVLRKQMPETIIELKKEIKEIKENVNKILELMNVVYEFQNS